MEDKMENAVAETLAAEFKPTPLRPLPRAVADQDGHLTWLRLGEKLHDQAVSKVAELTQRRDMLRNLIVGQMRDLEQAEADLAAEQSKVHSFRSRLGYGG